MKDTEETKSVKYLIEKSKYKKWLEEVGNEMLEGFWEVNDTFKLK